VVTAPGVVKSVTETTLVKLNEASIHEERDLRTIRTEGKYLIISNDSPSSTTTSKRSDEVYSNAKGVRRCGSYLCFVGRPKLLTIVRLAALFILLAGTGTFLGFLIGSHDVQDGIVDALEWLSDLPKWASSILVAGMYCVSLLFFCPGTPFNLAAGFLFGVWIGCGVALGGCILGACIAFVLGRTIAREWVKQKVEKKPKFRAVDWAIQKNGLYIVFLTRLSPLFPFPLLNYAFGITKVRVWQYMLGTFLGVLPATVAYTYLGTLMRSLTDIWSATDVNNFTLSSIQNGNHKNLFFLILGGILTVGSIIIISFITKTAISKATKEYQMMHGSNSIADGGFEDVDDLGDTKIELLTFTSDNSDKKIAELV